MFLTFDIGGTHLRGARYCSTSGKIVAERKITSPTYVNSGGALVALEKLCQNLRTLGQDLFLKPPRAVCLAFPGPVTRDGSILAAPSLFGEKLPVHNATQLLRENFWDSVPMFVLNDVTAAGYRYVTSERQNLCIITVSSGIGSKIFIDGKPLIGSGYGGEIGHFQADDSPDAPLCDCGGRGHLNAMASGRGVLALAKDTALRDWANFESSYLFQLLPQKGIGALDTFLLAKAFHAQDPWTLSVVKMGTKWLGRQMALIHLAIGIDSFVIIGGFAKALGEPYRQLLIDVVESSSWNTGHRWQDMIQLGHPDDLDGLTGAGVYAADQLK
ncbi:MAG: ROK family protein [Alphaproteobacteria bacterium]|nr:ROK family protein [Alphaproteobacteria bacterium]